MKKLGIAVLILIISVMTGLTVSAEESMYALYDFTTDTVTVSGNANHKKELVLFMILPESENINSITEQSINKNKYVTYQMRNDSDGNFEFSVQMPSGMKGGKYKVYAFCGSSELVCEFSYVNEKEINDLIKDINKGNKTEITRILKDNKDIVGIEEDQISVIDDIASLVYTMRPSAGYTANSFMEELKRSSALTLIKKGSPLEDVIRNYGISFGSDAASEINSMSDKNKETFVDYIKNNSVQSDTKKFFYQSIMMTYVINANSYVEMGEKIEEYKGNAGLIISGVTSEVYKKVFAANVKTFGALESALKNASDNQTNNNKDTSFSGGGSSAAVWSGNENINTNNRFPVTPDTNQNTSQGELTDISGHWGEDCIKRLVFQNIISGYTDGTFKPDNAVTRAEFVKLIVSALDMEIKRGQSFDDVNETDWCYQYISTASQNGIIYGYGSEFHPNDFITRQDAAVILYRALNIENSSASVSLSYEDSAEISDYALEAVSELSKNGILSGDGNKFNPKNNTTRAESAVMIERMLDYSEGLGNEDNKNSEELSDYKEIYGLVSALSTSEERMPYSKEMVKRGDFVQTVMEVSDMMKMSGKTLSFEDVDAGSGWYKALSAAVGMFLIEDGKNFRPEDAITLDEAAQICVKLTGYGIKAEYEGGTAQNYISKAAELGITDGLTPNTYLTCADAYRMLMNTLESDYLTWDGSNYKQGNGNVLKSYRNIEKIKGIVTSNEYTSTGSYSQMDTDPSSLSGTIGIGGTRYDVSGDFNKYLGYSVDAYITESKDGQQEVVYVCKRKENSDAEFKSRDFEYSDGYIYDENNRRKKYKLNRSAEVIYNGRVYYDYNLDDLNNICGSVKVVDNNDDRNFDYIIIEDYYYMEVASFDRTDKIIRDTRDADKELKFEDDVVYSVYSDEEQRECDLGEVSQGSILAVKRSADSKLVDMIIMGRLVSGKIDSLTDDKMRIDGKEYYMTGYFIANDYDGIRAGKNADLYLGINDEIVASSYTENVMKYGYLVNAWLEDNGDDIGLKIFTDKGEMQYFACEDKLICDGKRTKTEDVLNIITETGKKQLIKYSLSADNKVKYIDFSKRIDGYIDESKAVNETDSLVRQVFANQYYYRVSTFYPYFNIQNTLIFRIPETDDDESSYAIGYSFNDGMVSDGKVEVYNVGFDGTAEALVVYADNNESSINRTSPKIILVEDVTLAVTDDDEVKTMITGWENGQFKEYYLKEGLTVQKYRQDASIASGDIIRFTENNNEITAAVVEFIGEDRSPNVGDNLGSFNVQSTDCHYQIGSVYSYENSWALISNKTGDDGYEYAWSNLINVNIPDNIAIFNTQTKEIRTGTKDNIKTYLNSGNNASYIVVKQHYGSSNFCIIYE